ncbi:MAG: dTMP kinase [Cryomorphaceae bacterium]|nr:dTMP kinase [Cryomorphaceae bacterium]
MQKNLFIALEGIDGSGKTTQAEKLADYLKAKGHKVHLTCEPTKNRIGRMIRDIFSGKLDADHRVIAALFAADRLDHLLNKKDGLLKLYTDGYTIICDRHYLSSYAYHAVHTSMDWVIESNALSKSILKPDLHLYIDMDPKESMDRINKTRPSTELYETLENLIEVRDKYEEAINRISDEEKIVRINGNKSISSVSKKIISIIDSHL